MDGVHWTWTRDETVFAVFAMLIVAMSTFGIDRLLFRPKNLRRRSPDPRKHRVSYIVEEIQDHKEQEEENRKSRDAG